MTNAQRDVVRVLRDSDVRARARQEQWEHGTPDCDWCGAPIEQKPGKRFCGDRCRKGFHLAGLSR